VAPVFRKKFNEINGNNHYNDSLKEAEILINLSLVIKNN
jgi:hypothetical protein